MQLQNLSLEQFRSYQNLSVDFSSGNVHVLVGDNGAGKTNVLESIALLSLVKSCHNADEQDVMQWGTEFYRVRAAVKTDADEEKTLEVTSQIAPRKQKACFINDVKVSVSDMVGALPIILFLPQELDLFTGAPQQRRSFLDQLLCQVSQEYLHELVQYGKLLKQRNSLLRNIAESRANASDLHIWDEQISMVGSSISLKRLEALEVLQCTLQEELASLGEQWDDPQLVYERKGTERELPSMQTEIMELLQKNQQRDIQLQSTSVGPHREDWRIDVDGRSLPTFASRGQQRTAVLALLFLQVSYLELRRDEKPVILLDDVFSELDDTHQVALLQSFTDHQVIITSTHVPSNVEGAVVWSVEKGVVTNKS